MSLEAHVLDTYLIHNWWEVLKLQEVALAEGSRSLGLGP